MFDCSEHDCESECERGLSAEVRAESARLAGRSFAPSRRGMGLSCHLRMCIDKDRHAH